MRVESRCAGDSMPQSRQKEWRIGWLPLGIGKKGDAARKGKEQSFRIPDQLDCEEEKGNHSETWASENQLQRVPVGEEDLERRSAATAS